MLPFVDFLKEYVLDEGRDTGVVPLEDEREPEILQAFAGVAFPMIFF